MAILLTCRCGRTLSIDDSKAGKRGRCAACGAVLKIPDAPPIPAGTAKALDRADHSWAAADELAPPPPPVAIRTPAWLLYLGLVASGAILWGILATAKLQQRTRQLEEAVRRADMAEEAVEVTKKASTAAIAQAEAIKERAIVEAEAIKRELKALREKADAAALKAAALKDETVRKQHPDFRKIVSGDNWARDRYVELFTLENGVVRVKFRNPGRSSVRPDFSIIFFDEDGAETNRADISWLFTTIGPNETSSDEASIHPRLGPPAYYTLKFREEPPPANAAGGDEPPPVAAAGGDDQRSAILSVGDRVILQNEGNTLLFVATDDSAWDAMLDAEGANSVELMQRLIIQGKVIAVQSDTAAVIVKNGFLSKLVLIKGGLRPDARAGYRTNTSSPPGRDDRSRRQAPRARSQ